MGLSFGGSKKKTTVNNTSIDNSVATNFQTSQAEVGAGNSLSHVGTFIQTDGGLVNRGLDAVEKLGGGAFNLADRTFGRSADIVGDTLSGGIGVINETRDAGFAFGSESLANILNFSRSTVNDSVESLGSAYREANETETQDIFKIGLVLVAGVAAIVALGVMK